MSKELKFYHPEFEQVVRQELLISDRAITNEDALGKRFERVITLKMQFLSWIP